MPNEWTAGGTLQDFSNYLHVQDPDQWWVYFQPGAEELAYIAYYGANNGWSRETIEANFHQTDWWHAHSESSRNWTWLSAADPAESQKRLEQARVVLDNNISRLGFPTDRLLSGWDYPILLDKAVREGWDEAELRRQLLIRIGLQQYSGDFSYASQMPGEFGDAMTHAWEQARAYGVNVDMHQVATYALGVLQGTDSAESITQKIRNQAKAAYWGNSTITDAIDSGMTVMDFAQPYAQLAAQELEVNPNDIDWADAKWNTALNTMTQQGVRAPLSLNDWTVQIRNDAQYGFDNTNNAQKQSASLTSGLASMFGATGG